MFISDLPRQRYFFSRRCFQHYHTLYVYHALLMHNIDWSLSLIFRKWTETNSLKPKWVANEHPSNQTGVSPLIAAVLSCVKGFVLDHMHLIFLGVKCQVHLLVKSSFSKKEMHRHDSDTGGHFCPFYNM